MNKIRVEEFSETLTMLLTLELHRNKTLKERAMKIRVCAKHISKYPDLPPKLKVAMKQLRNSKDDATIIDAIEEVDKRWHNCVVTHKL